jgi:hypothetical protein
MLISTWHGGDVDDTAGFLDLPDVYIAQADVLDETLVSQRDQRPDARRERRPRIARMKLIEMETGHVKCPPACLARGGQMARPSVGDPSSVGPRQAAFGGHENAGGIAAPRCDGASNEPLVVPDVVLVESVGVGRVDEANAGIERRMQHRDGTRVVAPGIGRKAHGAQAHQRATRNVAAHIRHLLTGGV